MYNYSLLETSCYYLIQEKAEGPINLIKVNMDTDYCLFITRFGKQKSRNGVGRMIRLFIHHPFRGDRDHGMAKEG